MFFEKNLQKTQNQDTIKINSFPGIVPHYYQVWPLWRLQGQYESKEGTGGESWTFLWHFLGLAVKWDLGCGPWEISQGGPETRQLLGYSWGV